MNLLFTITAYPPSIGGAQLHHHQLALDLVKRHKIQVVSHWSNNRTDWLLGTTLRAPDEGSDYVHEGIPVHLIALSPAQKRSIAPSVLTYYLAMGRAVEKIGHILADQVRPFAAEANLIHNVRIGRANLSKASLLLAHQQDIPFIITPVHHPRWSGWRNKEYHKIYREADGVIALTQAEKRVLMELGVRDDRIFITGIGPILSADPDGNRFRRQHALEGPIVLFLGQHYRYKGYQELLQATSKVWEKAPETSFVFIGPPVGRSEALFREKHDPRILRLGEVDLGHKSDALAACDILCVPSTQESFGGVYTEAWSLGRPVIGCKIPAVSEVIAHGEDGFLVEQKPSEIAERIIDLLLNDNLREEMGLKGRQKAEEIYSWDQIALRTEEIYLALLG